MKFLVVIFTIFYSLIFSFSGAAQVVVFPGHENQQFIPNLLTHALSYTPEKNYQVAFYGEDLPKIRVFLKIANNNGIDIVATGATKEKERDLLAIPFPLLKGLYGWRIPLVNADNINLFANELTLTEFKQLSPGQLHSWSDTKVLESNGILVTKGSSYQGLFKMLATHRYDYFPRSIVEINRDYDQNKHLPIMIDSHILIHYPAAYVFYVNKEKAELASDILMGLNQAHSDGSLANMYHQFYGEQVERVRQQKRKIIHLENSLLPEKMPLNRKDLWLDFSN